MNDSKRITFLLYDGTRTDMTFCRACAEVLTPDLYVPLWQKNLRSWMREFDIKKAAASGAQRPWEGLPRWLALEFANGMLCEIARIPWKELTDG
jgi:hypothetical protein